MKHRKLYSVGTVLALFLSLFVVTALPAAAQPVNDEVQLFMPEGNLSDKDQLSDEFDGVDELAHLTAVAGEDYDNVTFFFCENGFAPNIEDALQDSDVCEEVGEDTTGVDPSEGADPDDDNIDEHAYETFVDIGETDLGSDEDDVSVVALACEGEPDEDDDFENCAYDQEDDIQLDDSDGTGGNDFPSGEFVGICYAERHFGSYGQEYNDSSECDEASEFQPLTHGDAVSSEGFHILVRTSDDVTGTGLDYEHNDDQAIGACADLDADSDDEPSGCDIFDDEVTQTADDAEGAAIEGGSAVTADADDYNEFIIEFKGTGFGDNDTSSEFDLAIYGRSDDSVSDCVADFSSGDTEVDGGGTEHCVFSEIYLHTEESEPTTVRATFDEDGSRQPDPRDGGTDQSYGDDLKQAVGNPCEDPQLTADNEVGDVGTVIACVEDQFGRAATESAVTFESEGVGGFVEETCEGSNASETMCTEDVVDFEEDETETGEDDVTGVASVDITSEQAGTQTITVCADDEGGEGDEGGDEGLSGAGCDADDPSTTLTKNWGGATAATVDLVFQSDTSQGCAGNSEFRQNRVGDTDTLVVCTYDQFGNPTSTDELGSDLEWDVENPNVATFTDQAGNPPSETGSNGQASATIRANSAGTTEITVCVQRAGETDECDTVTKTVSGDTPPPVGRPECSDDVDNDNDGTVDFDGPGTPDSDCSSANDTSENPTGQPFALCSNRVDDDGDGRTDGQDPGCSGPNDNSESPDPRTIRVATNLTIRYDRNDNAFKGSVGSPRKRCQTGRDVTLFRRGDGSKGRDASNFRGNWKINRRARNGNWFAQVSRKQFQDRQGNTIICRPDESVTIKL